MKRLLLTILACFALLSGCSRMNHETYTDPIHQDRHFMYARTHLNNQQKTDYDQIFNGLMDHKEKIIIAADTETDIVKIFDSVLADHPEIYWTAEFRYQKDTAASSKTVFYPVYAFDQAEINMYNKQLEAISKQIIQGISKQADDYEKVKYVFDFIIDQTDYAEDALNSQNIISSLINKTSVCAGYAKAVQYLLAMLNVDCALITGKAKDSNISHAWNMVKMDDAYYYLDATYADSADNQNIPEYRYMYFGMTTDEIERLYYDMAPHEDTFATADTYFMKNHGYFTHYDEDRIQALVNESVNSGSHSLLLKFDSLQTMQIVQQRLTDQQQLFSMLEINGIALKNVNYYMIPELNCILYFY